MADKPPPPDPNKGSVLVGVPKSNRLKPVKPAGTAPAELAPRGPAFAPIIPKTEGQKAKPNITFLQKPPTAANPPKHSFAPRAGVAPRGAPYRGRARGAYGPPRGGGYGKPKLPGQQHAPAAASPASGPRKRKVKEYNAGEIAPTAETMRIDPLDPSHPITLPFMDPHMAARRAFEQKQVKKEDIINDDKDGMDLEGDEASTSEVKAEKKGAVPVDPRKKLADLFRNDVGDFSGDDQVFFMQLPAVLPVQASAQEAKDRAEAISSNVPVSNNGPATVKSTTDAAAAITGDGTILGYKSTLTSIPSGKIGKLLVFKSGKVKLQVGEVLFDISTGMPTTFLQEIVAIHTESKKYYQLSDINKRLVCFPDIGSLVTTTEHSPQPQYMDTTE